MVHELDDSLVQAFYEAAAGLVPWAEPLAALHRAIRVLQIQLVVVDKTTGQLVASEQPLARFSQRTVDGTLDHIREYHRIDLHIAHGATLPVGEVMNSADVFPRKVYADHPFYRDFWSAYNARALLGAKVAEDERYVAMLGMTRTYDQPAYAVNEVRLFTRYVGHLAAAFRITQHLQKLHPLAAAGVALMEASRRPMALLNARGQILATNVAANAFLESGNGLFARDGSLDCRSTKGAQILAEALARLREQTPGDTSSAFGQRIALRIPSPGAKDILCSVWAMRPESTMGAFGLQPAALLTIAVSDADEAVDPIFLGSMFELTPAEVRVATALMHGRDLRQIAAVLRLSIETVRSQVKSVFAKTGTHRQTELIQLLHCATSS